MTRGLLPDDKLPEFDVSGLTDKKMLPLLTKLAAAVASPYSEEDEESYWEKVDKAFEALNVRLQNNYFNNILTNIDTEAVENSLTEDRYISDIKSLKEKVKSDPKIAHALRKSLASENQFIPLTLLAKQYALACYANPDSINTPEVATGFIESLLKSGKYSPFLPELWRMWRCRIQVDALSRSNDGIIQNHLYNALKNQVATTILREYSQNHSSDALDAFLCMALEYNIFRSGNLIGNSANDEDGKLFWAETKR